MLVLGVEVACPDKVSLCLVDEFLEDPLVAEHIFVHRYDAGSAGPLKFSYSRERYRVTMLRIDEHLDHFNELLAKKYGLTERSTNEGGKGGQNRHRESFESCAMTKPKVSQNKQNLESKIDLNVK